MVLVRTKRTVEQVEPLTKKEERWLSTAIDVCSDGRFKGDDALNKIPHNLIARQLGMSTAYWKGVCFPTLYKKLKGLTNYLTWLQYTEQGNVDIEIVNEHKPTERTTEKMLSKIPGGEIISKMLTKKQADVLCLLCSGLSIDDIKGELQMDLDHINRVLSNIEKRIPGVTDRLEELGLLNISRETPPDKFAELPNHTPINVTSDYEKSLDSDGNGADIVYGDGHRDRAVRRL